VGGADSFGAAQMFCGDSKFGAQHRKMIADAWINIVCLAELGPAIYSDTPLGTRENANE
jgi:hypothetical protein